MDRSKQKLGALYEVLDEMDRGVVQRYAEIEGKSVEQVAWERYQNCIRAWGPNGGRIKKADLQFTIRNYEPRRGVK